MTSSDEFSWGDAKDAGDLIIPEQAAVAVYQNPDGNIVIRQQSDYGEDDHYIVVQLANLPRLITALEQARIKAHKET